MCVLWLCYARARAVCLFLRVCPCVAPLVLPLCFLLCVFTFRVCSGLFECFVCVIVLLIVLIWVCVLVFVSLLLLCFLFV